MARDFSHLDAIEQRLSNERGRLAVAEALLPEVKGRRRAKVENEIAFRRREVASAERERAHEMGRLGIDMASMTDEELFAALDDIEATIREVGAA